MAQSFFRWDADTRLGLAVYCSHAFYPTRSRRESGAADDAVVLQTAVEGSDRRGSAAKSVGKIDVSKVKYGSFQQD